MLSRWSVPPLLALLALAGCSEEPSGPQSSLLADALSITPTDGASDVWLDTPVTLRFAEAVDRAVVNRDFNLISEFDMLGATCPDSTMATHGTMMTVMTDTMMMRHMTEFHGTDGTFAWNATNTECAFWPTSWLRPQTRYMVHMGPEMAQMMESRMGSKDGMGGHGMGPMGTDMTFHFTTMDTTGGNHQDHH